MTTNLQLIQRAARITLNNKLLWVLGIFLSSGFNLHAWYGWQWLGQGDWSAELLATVHSLGQATAWLILAGGMILVILLVNFLKLIFFGHVHNQLHQAQLEECLLCGQLRDQTVLQMLRQKRSLWLRTVAVSVITVLASIGVVGLFHFYTSHSQFHFLTAALMLASLIIVLIGISWWNLFTVLFMMWHGFPLSKAAGLALDLLVSRLRRVGSITVLTTILFLVSIVAGASVLFQLPEFFASAPNFVFTGSVFHTWQIAVSVVSTGLFAFWLILNNVWFNVVMVSLFDELVTADKHPAADSEALFVRSPASAPFHHSIDRTQKM